MSSRRALFLSFVLLAFAAAVPARAQFTSGNLVVLRGGDGNQTLSSDGNAMFLDQYGPTAANQTAPGFSVNLTAAVTNALFEASGSASSEGQIALSSDGHSIAVPGYDGTNGGGSSLSGATSATVPRGYVLVSATGAVSPFVSTSTQFSANNIRAAYASVVGNTTNVYVAGANGKAGGGLGIYLFPANTTVENTVANIRSVRVFNGNLGFTTAKGSTLGTDLGVWIFSGIPTANATPTLLVNTASDSDPGSYSINPAGTTTYVAENNGNGQVTVGIERWDLAGGTWTLNYTINVTPATGTGALGLAVDYSGAKPVLYATTADVTNNQLVRVVDTGASSSVTILATAGNNEYFHGVDFAPTGAVAAPTITTQPGNVGAPVGGNATFSAAASGATFWQWQISTNAGSSWVTLNNSANVSGAATGSVTISNIASSYNGYEFRLLATNSGGNATSNAATLTIGVAPSITTQPGNTTVLVGGNATFTTAVSGSPTPTLQWQVSTNGGTSFTNLSNGANISGVTTGTLTISNTTLAESGYEYQLVATNSIGNATTNAATLMVAVAPAITTQPVSATEDVGGSAEFTTVASGTPTPGLQWQISTNSGGNWSNLSNNGTVSGATTGSLVLLNLILAQSGNEFRAVATNAGGNATSNVATLTVTIPPSITASPGNTTVITGGNATFTAAAGGTPAPTLQWQISTNGGGNWTNLSDGGNVSGSASGTLTVSNVTLGLSGDEFRVIATNVGGNSTSVAATLTVNAPPFFSTQPGNESVLAGNSTIFTAVAAGVPSPTLQWQISTNSGGTWSNLADGGNISGATTGSLTISNTTLAQSGEEFQVVATNVAGNATSTAAVMTVSLEPVAPAITTPPANTTVNTGENAIFTAVASGTPTPGLQWQISTDSGGNWTNLSDGGNVSGSATGTLTFGNVAFDQSGDEFRVVANSTAGNATSSAATVTVFVPPSFSTAPANTTVLVGGNATFTAAASGVPTPTVQWQISTDGGGNWTNLNDGANISGSGTNTLTVSNATLAESGDEFQLVATSNAGNAISGAATLTVALAPAISTQPGNTTAIAGDNATFTAAASGTPAPSLQWQVSAGGVDPWINLSDDANISGSTTGTLTLSNLTVSQSGQDFRLVAANPGGNATSNAATLTVAAKVAPGVKSAPSSQTVTAGAKASFTASFTGTPAPTLQWQFSTNAGKSWTNLANGGAYSGVTTGTLSVSGTTTAMSGTQFRLMATNSAGTLDSAAVTLTVNAPVVAPKITTQPKALSVKKGAKATFTVKASGTAPLTYQWMFNKKSLKNGGGISGATTVTLTISKAATSNGGAYTVKVTNKAGSVTSASVKLTVKS